MNFQIISKKIVLSILLLTLSQTIALAKTHKTNSVLFILSAHHSGYWLPEVIEPYQLLKENGFNVEFASPQGAPGYPAAANQLSEEQLRIYDSIRPQISTPKPLKAVKSENYLAVFFPGGAGPVFDLPGHPQVNRLVNEFYDDEKVIAALCHGPAALAYVDLENGKRLIAGLKTTGKSNAEEFDSADSWFPFLIEDRFKQSGSAYSAAAPKTPYIVWDFPLLTGQNPESTTLLTNKLIALISH